MAPFYSLLESLPKNIILLVLEFSDKMLLSFMDTLFSLLGGPRNTICMCCCESSLQVESHLYLTVKQHQPLFQCLHLHSAVHTLQFVKFDAQVSQMVVLKILVGQLGFSKNN